MGEAAALELMHDHDGRAKPSWDWDDPVGRAWLVDELVEDARAVLAAVGGLDLTDEQADAVGLLAAVAGLSRILCSVASYVRSFWAASMNSTLPRRSAGLALLRTQTATGMLAP